MITPFLLALVFFTADMANAQRQTTELRSDWKFIKRDFTVFGGIYRPVKLIATDTVCISPLEHASPGVFLTTKSADRQQALVGVKTLVSSAEKTEASAQIETEVKDADGKVVLNRSSAVKLAAGESKSIATDLTIASPHLWQGRKDPYLYSVTVRVKPDSMVFKQRL